MSDPSSSSSPPVRPASAPSASAAAERLTSLLQQVALKDRDAFSQLYQATSAKLYGTVLRILGNTSWADDVVQEAYVNIWQKASQFDAGKSSPITWMVSIARNGAIDELRRQPTARRDHDEALEEIASSAPTAGDQLSQEQNAQQLYECLDELEDNRRDMVRLAYLHGWSRADLASRFDQPVNTIKTWLHRALKQLKGCLAS
ncbi:sigma-70 family RNA polymerase sigma factor [Halomonas huangheensis]|uniref:RNA polymerase subunit sigma-24 n=1 Tax=Halomonas huangheensis TaxID=1178482 RepID=W1N8Z9_9GAMM|nr:sigma-70 family RNA polymerase sigma factor [Halomonas huangheensis]ALM53358.1 RNA polymerase subunit sigma-24 [Halomonas huangheensis]ERL51993.1 hypothetical protein BJB45_12560 [Halomonas huangheensis]